MRSSATQKVGFSIALASLVGLALVSSPDVGSRLVPGFAPDARAEAGDGETNLACSQPCLAASVHKTLLDHPAPAAVSPKFTTYPTFYSGGEPTIGVSPNGQHVYVQVGLNTLRSLNGGAAFGPIQPIGSSVVSFDPMLHYDPVIDRLYLNHLTVECSILAWTDQPSTVAGGLDVTKWKMNPHACGLPGIDHQKLEGGPSPILGAANEGRALYMGYSQAGGGAMVAKSLDGGFTWINAVATPSVIRGTLLWPTGPVTADPAGSYVYLPHHNPSAGLRVAVSSNEGLTYATVTASTASGASGHAVDPEVAVDEAGNAYVVWYDRANHQVYYQYSTNHGASWSARTKVSNATILSAVFPTAVAKGDGNVSIAFLGTKDSTAGPDNCAATGASRCRWYVFHARIGDATTGSPSITQTQVTPDNDPIQIGKICTKGIDCAAGTRGLLDFIDTEVDGSGYSHIGYADGCVGTCTDTSSGQTTASSARYARQTGGTPI